MPVHTVPALVLPSVAFVVALVVVAGRGVVVVGLAVAFVVALVVAFVVALVVVAALVVVDA